jgi:hypothetical protein
MRGISFWMKNENLPFELDNEKYESNQYW